MPVISPHPRSTAATVIGGGAVLILLSVASLFVGSGDVSPAQVWSALTTPDGSATSLIVTELRIPRTVLALAAGIALGLSGTLIQALTRNPLADPGILGVNAGAYTAVVCAAALWGTSLTGAHVWAALGGALVTSLVVYGIGGGGRSGAQGGRLVLAGVAVGATLTGISSAITLMNPAVFDRVRFWSAGSLQGRSFDTLWSVAPFIVVGTIVALLLPRALNLLSMGDEVARSLGGRPTATKSLTVIAVALLCGAATAAAGPISFVGLMVPHALRAVVGSKWQRIAPLSLIAAPIVLLSADLVGRVIVSAELPVGVVTALLGAPVLIWVTLRNATPARSAVTA